MQPTLFIAGGSGFAGQAICRTAIGSGYRVKALSRDGRPPLDAAWVDQVEWIHGNALEPDTWMRHLEGCDAVIHCIGIISETPRSGETFERVNAETAVSLADAAAKKGVNSFVMLSAFETPPMVPERYLEAKRYAEESIKERHPDMRCVFLRPIMLYGPQRPWTIPVGRTMEFFRWMVPGLQPKLPNAVHKLASTAVYAATHADVDGVIDATEIDDLAETSALSLEVPPPPPTRGGKVAILGSLAAAGLAAYAVLRGRDH